MKKIINRTDAIVHEMGAGIVFSNPELEFIPKYKVIKKRAINPAKVTLISGGGSGHEPAHAGYIGKGMLDAAVCGDVFASPSQVQIYQAIRETKSDKGTLLIVKNYSGDVMNFRNAAYLAEEDGLKTGFVLVGDDIAVKDSLYTVGRRGVAGTVLVHKIAGAAAERGLSLEAVQAAAEKAAANVRSIGFALTSCTVPAKGTPTFQLGEDEIEYGVGIHGEPGIQKEKLLSADELAARAIDALLEDLGAAPGQEVALLVNGFGATPLMELYLLAHSAGRSLAEKAVKIRKCFVGNYMTSLDMNGASLTLMKLDEELSGYLFDSSLAPAFRVDPASANDIPVTLDLSSVAEDAAGVSYEIETDASYADIAGGALSLENIIYMVDVMSACIIKNEVPFCELDSFAGDGDFGMSIAKGFRHLKTEWAAILQSSGTIGRFLDTCSLVLMEYCGGASGPIWGAAFRAAGKTAGETDRLTLKQFAEVLLSSVVAIQAVGERSFGRGAVVGDKTLIDALLPCAERMRVCAESGTDIKTALTEGAGAAALGAKATEDIVARMGRAGTVGERSLGHPDAGAYALGVIFTEIANAMKTAD